MTTKIAALRTFIALCLAVAAGASSGLVAQSQLLGQWKHPGGFLIEFRQTGSEIVGVVIEASEAAAAVGYRVGDVVIRNVKIDGGAIQFEATVAPESASHLRTCAPAKWPFKGQLQPESTTFEVSAPNFGYMQIRLDDNQTICQLMPAPGTKIVTYERVVSTDPRTLRAVRLTRTGFHPVESLAHGRPFYLEAEYVNPGSNPAPRTVQIATSGVREPETIVLKHVGGSLFRSDPIALVPRVPPPADQAADPAAEPPAVPAGSTTEPSIAGRYLIAYEDSRFGQVQGVAEIHSDARTGNVTVVSPRSQAEYKLLATISREGRRLTMVLDGESPDAAAADGPADPAWVNQPEPRVVLVNTDEKQLRASSGTRHSTLPITPAPSIDNGRVSLHLELTDNNDILTGTWSYFADPDTQRDRSGRGRVARFGTIEKQGVRHGVQYGFEQWRRATPAIAGVIVLEEQVERTHPEVAPYAYPFVAGQREGWTARTLFVYGLNLPTTYNEARAFVSADPALQYYVKYLRADLRKSSATIPDFARGWRRLLERVRPEDRPVFEAMDAVIVDVRMKRGVLPGPKTFELNGAPAAWSLQFGNNLADMRFVRVVSPDRIEPAGSRFVSGTEDATNVFVEETVAVEVRTDIPLPLESIPVAIGHNETVVPSSAGAVWQATRVKGSQTVYRTSPLRLVASVPPAGQQDQTVRYLAVRDEDDLFAQAAASGLLLMRKQSRQVSNGLAAAAAREQERRPPMYDARATVAQAPARIGASFKEALVRAAACKGIAVTDWDSLSATRHHEIKRTIVTRWERRRIPVTVSQVAAMLMLRDEFVRTLKDLRSRIPSIKGVEALRSFRDTFGPLMDSPDFPLSHVRVTGPQQSSPIEIDVPYSLAFKEDFASEYFKKYFGDDRAAARKWSDAAVKQGLERYRQGIDTAIKHAEETADTTENTCDVQDLIKLTGLSFGPVVQLLQPKLMTLSATPGTRMTWVPDHDAREAVKSIEPLAADVRKLEALNAVDNAILLVGASLLTMPLMLTQSMLGAAIMLAVDVTDLSYAAISGGIEYHQSRREVAFALGASEILGPDRLAMARANERSVVGLAVDVGLGGLGATGSALAVASRMNRIAGLRALERMQRAGAAAVPLTPAEARSVRALMDEIGATPAEALSQEHKRAIAMMNEIKTKHGLDLETTIANRLKPAAAVAMPTPEGPRPHEAPSSHGTTTIVQPDHLKPKPKSGPTQDPDSWLMDWARQQDRTKFVDQDGKTTARGTFLDHGGFAEVHVGNTSARPGRPESVVKFYENQVANVEDARQVVLDQKEGALRLRQAKIRQIEDVHYQTDAGIPWIEQRQVGKSLPKGVLEEKLWDKVRDNSGGRVRVGAEYEDAVIDVYGDLLKSRMVAGDLKPKNIAWQRIPDPDAPPGSNRTKWVAAFLDKDQIGSLRPDGSPDVPYFFAGELEMRSMNKGALRLSSQGPGEIVFTSPEHFMVLEMERHGMIRFDPASGKYEDGLLRVAQIKHRLDLNVDQFIRVKPHGASGGAPKVATESLPDEHATVRIAARELLEHAEAWRRVRPDARVRLSPLSSRPDVASIVRRDPEALNRARDQFGLDAIADELRWDAHTSVESLEAALRRRRGRIDAPREGLYDGIDPEAVPPGWRFDHRPSFDPNTGELSVTTAVEGPGVSASELGRGTFTRSYDRKNGVFIFDSANRRHGEPANPWVRTPDQPELVPGRGTPTVALVTMHQMRQWNIAPGSLKEFKWKNVINVESALHLAWLKKQFPDSPLEELFARTFSYRYGETAITQSGHVVDNLKLTDPEWVTLEAALEYALDKEEAAALVVRYGLTSADKIPIGFNVTAKVRPHPGLKTPQARLFIPPAGSLPRPLAA